MKCTTRWLLGWLALLTAMPGAAQSVLDIEITGGTEAALPIAIVLCTSCPQPDNNSTAAIGKDNINAFILTPVRTA